MKTIFKLLLCLLLVSGISCSMQSRFTKKFKGKTKTELDEYFRQKGVIHPLTTEQNYVTYTQTEILKSTPVNKGVATLDPMISPSVKKTRKFIFYLDPEGKVSDCKYDVVYQP